MPPRQPPRGRGKPPPRKPKEPEAPKQWGSLARKGVGRMRDDRPFKAAEAFRRLTGSTEQHPVLADCYRALKRYREVEALWEELRETSPSAELVAEGRIVAAGALADQRAYDRAIRMLEAGVRNPKRIKLHHVRVLYVLADVVERAGDVPRARQLFRRVADADPEFADVQARIRALR